MTTIILNKLEKIKPSDTSLCSKEVFDWLLVIMFKVFLFLTCSSTVITMWEGKLISVKGTIFPDKLIRLQKTRHPASRRACPLFDAAANDHLATTTGRIQTGENL